MKTIIAIVCTKPESIDLLNFPKAFSDKLKDCKNESFCYREMNNIKDARYYFALDLIQDKYISREDKNNIIKGKKRELEVDGLNISIRTGSEMKSFMKIYNSLT